MLKKDNKINKKKEFDNIFKKGRSSFDKIIGVKALKNDLKDSRFGIIISTKVSKKAVERNKIKRQIRAILLKEILKIKDNIDTVIIVLPDIKEKTFQEIEISIQKHFKKLNIYN